MPSKRDLTSKDMQVLAMISERLTVKEMAARQGVSISAINKRIRTLKEVFEVNTHRELHEAYAEMAEKGGFDVCTESTCTKNALPEFSEPTDRSAQDEKASVAALQDSITMRIDTPWAVHEEPRIVPRMLDGPNAGLLRSVAIMAITLLILAGILVSLGVAQGITEALRGTEIGPREVSQ